jgi:hypothetical protein
MDKRHSATTEITRSDITMGSALAMILSYSVNQSILWAILHGFFSWLYVIYFAIVRLCERPEPFVSTMKSKIQRSRPSHRHIDNQVG